MSDRNINSSINAGGGGRNPWLHPGRFFLWAGVVLLTLCGLTWIGGLL
jgi:hypothetical protein